MKFKTLSYLYGRKTLLTIRVQLGYSNSHQSTEVRLHYLRSPPTFLTSFLVSNTRQSSWVHYVEDTYPLGTDNSGLQFFNCEVTERWDPSTVTNFLITSNRVCYEISYSVTSLLSTDLELRSISFSESPNFTFKILSV